MLNEDMREYGIDFDVIGRLAKRYSTPPNVLITDIDFVTSADGDSITCVIGARINVWVCGEHKLTTTGSAYRNPNDTPNQQIGGAIAFARALKNLSEIAWFHFDTD